MKKNLCQIALFLACLLTVEATSPLAAAAEKTSKSYESGMYNNPEVSEWPVIGLVGGIAAFTGYVIFQTAKGISQMPGAVVVPVDVLKKQIDARHGGGDKGAALELGQKGDTRLADAKVEIANAKKMVATPGDVAGEKASRPAPETKVAL